ncbi:MAG: ATP-binding protein, partial [Xanthobacteraceae bacterium]
VQRRRFEALGLPQIRTNGEAPAALLDEIARCDTDSAALLQDAARAMRLSARGYHRVLRVARTIADLAGASTIGRTHLAEALSYRIGSDDMRRAA